MEECGGLTIDLIAESIRAFALEGVDPERAVHDYVDVARQTLAVCQADQQVERSSGVGRQVWRRNVHRGSKQQYQGKHAWLKSNDLHSQKAKLNRFLLLNLIL